MTTAEEAATLVALAEALQAMQLTTGEREGMKMRKALLALGAFADRDRRSRRLPARRCDAGAQRSERRRASSARRCSCWALNDFHGQLEFDAADAAPSGRIGGRLHAGGVEWLADARRDNLRADEPEHGRRLGRRHDWREPAPVEPLQGRADDLSP